MPFKTILGVAFVLGRLAFPVIRLLKVEESKILRFRSLNHDLEEIFDHLSACMLISRDHSLIPLRKHVERAFVEAHFTAIEGQHKSNQPPEKINGELADRYSGLLSFIESEFLENEDAFIAYLLGITRKAIIDKYPDAAQGDAEVIGIGIREQV